MNRLNLIILLLILIAPLGVYARNPSSSLIVKGISGETVVFAKPTKMSRVKISNSKSLSDMTLDLTIISANDSISIKSTHLTDSPIQLDSVTLSTKTFIKRYPLNKIFVEAVGNKWRSRISFDIPRSEFLQLTSSTTPPMFIFGSQSHLIYQDKQKTWDNRKKVYNLMLEIIDINHE